MTIQIDPQGLEVQALLRMCGDLAGKRVLEIGCGDGRLTWRYASKAAHVTAIDPSPERIARAISHVQPDCTDKVEFIEMGLEEFAFNKAPIQPYQLAILSWSL